MKYIKNIKIAIFIMMLLLTISITSAYTANFSVGFKIQDDALNNVFMVNKQGDVNFTGRIYGNGSGLTEIQANAVEDAWVNVTGDTMTGDLNVNDKIVLSASRGNITSTGNLTLGEKIVFALGEVIDNILDSWVRVTGNLNVTGNLSIGTGTVLIDGTNNRIGIGTISPQSALHVIGSVNASSTFRAADGTAAAPSYTFDEDTNTGIRRHNTDNISLVTGGSDRVTIDSSGNVGIGTTLPQDRLHVIGNITVTGNVTADYLFGNGSQIKSITASNVEDVWVNTAGDTMTGSLNVNNKINISSSGDLNVSGQTLLGIYGGNVGINVTNPGYLLTTGFSGSGRDVNLSNVVFVNGSSGNVGIGTTSPGAKLDIKNADGDARIHLDRRNDTDNYQASIQFYTAGVGKWNIGQFWTAGSRGGFSFVDINNSDLRVMYLENGTGNVGIGTASPQYLLTVANGTNGAAINLSNVLYINSTNGNILIGPGDPTKPLDLTKQGQYMLNITGNASINNTLFVNTNGNVGIGTTSPARPLHVAGAIRLDPGTTPGSLANGDIWQDSDQLSLRKRIGGTTVGGVELLKTATSSSSAISNTAAETNFDVNFPIPANTLKAGKVIRITAGGSGEKTGIPSLTLRVKMGSTTIVAMPAGGPSSSFEWRVEANLIVRAIGASGTVSGNGWFILNDPTSFAASNHITDDAQTGVTVDTTAAQTLQISAQWSAADPANTVTMHTFVVEMLD